MTRERQILGWKVVLERYRRRDWRRMRRLAAWLVKLRQYNTPEASAALRKIQPLTVLLYHLIEQEKRKDDHAVHQWWVTYEPCGCPGTPCKIAVEAQVKIDELKRKLDAFEPS